MLPLLFLHLLDYSRLDEVETKSPKCPDQASQRARVAGEPGTAPAGTPAWRGCGSLLIACDKGLPFDVDHVLLII